MTGATRRTGHGPGIEGTSRPDRPAVACAGGPYNRMWWWEDDWTEQVTAAARNAQAWPGDGRRSPILDYTLTARQVVNPVKDLEHLVAQVAVHTPPRAAPVTA